MIQILEAKNALLDYKNKTRKNMFTKQPNIKELFSLIIYLGRVNNCPKPPIPSNKIIVTSHSHLHNVRVLCNHGRVEEGVGGVNTPLILTFGRFYNSPNVYIHL